MAIDRQADVVFTSSAGIVASTKLLHFGLESQNNRLGSGTERSSNCSTGLVKPRHLEKLRMPGQAFALPWDPGTVCPEFPETVNKRRSKRRFSL